MKSVFKFSSYQDVIRSYLDEQDKKAQGSRKRFLESIRMSSSLLTQILKEQKQISDEQAYEAALHFGFTEKEVDYFLLLVDHAKAGSVRLQERIRKKLTQLKNESERISSKITQDLVLSEADKVLYYSNWQFTGVRNFIAANSNLNVSEIAERLDLPVSNVEKILQFLIETGLVVKTKKGLESRSGYTHLGSEHPMVWRHHQNWRQKAIQEMDHFKEQHLHYTCPMAITKKAAEEIRTQLGEQIKQVNQLIKEGAEVAYCLNIDWFEY